MDLELLQILKDDFKVYAEKCLKIRTKSGQIQPFVLNKAQQYLHERLEEQLKETGKVRAVVLKGRQQGSSTYFGGRFYHKTTFNDGRRTFILTHDAEATNNLFELTDRYHEYNPIKPSTGNHSAKELTFPKLNSGYKVGTAGNKGVGRSQTIQFLHGSEVAFWPNADEHSAGIMQAVSDEPSTEIILESTANGIGNYFHKQWQLAESGESDYIAIFIPWFWQEEYKKPVKADFKASIEEINLKKAYGLTDEQLSFRRQKIHDLAGEDGDGEWRFKQEYPNTPIEAFRTSGGESLIQPEIVQKARDTKASRYGPKIIGVDPAWSESDTADRSAIAFRVGRCCYRVKTYKKNTMGMVGVINSIIDIEKPDRVFIDVVGIGAGIYDRLIEMGHSSIVRKVNGGETKSLLYPHRFKNKRAEMWGLMNEWLKDGDVQVPDDDELQADLCSFTYDYDSNSRLVLEKKKDLKKRGLRSPDLGDSLGMCFADKVKLEERTRVNINSGIIDAGIGY